MRTAVIVDGVTSTTNAGRLLDGIVETRPATVRHSFSWLRNPYRTTRCPSGFPEQQKKSALARTSSKAKLYEAPNV